MTVRRCNGQSCNGFSGRGLWIPWASASIPVPMGRTEWPLFSTGVAPAQVVEGTAAAAAVSATFLYANLKAKKLTGEYEYTHEVAASVPDLEQAIRRDLADSIKSKMSDLIINGAAVDPNDAATAANVEGFINALTQADDAACRGRGPVWPSPCRGR